MKVKDGFVLRNIADMYVVVPVGDTGVDFNGIITLNDTAAFLFKKLQSDTSREQILQDLLDEYNVDRDSAYTDIDDFLARLKEADLIA